MTESTPHTWTPKQTAFLAESQGDSRPLREIYQDYRRRFGPWASSFNQFRTRRYCLLHPQVGARRARIHRERAKVRRLFPALARAI